MRMPFSHEAPPSRMERARCAMRDRASDAAHRFSGAAHTVSGAAVTAQSAAMNAAGVAQVTAAQVTDRATVVAHQANTAAHQVADRAQVAAVVLAERARPVAAEAAARGGAAWQVLRYGAPAPSPMARVVAVMPVAAVRAARRGRAPIGLMALGAAGAICLLLWRRSRAGEDNVWILDSDSDVEPVGRWQEGDRRSATDDTATDSGRRDSPVNRWP